jgi:hypothetical protein
VVESGVDRGFDCRCLSSRDHAGPDPAARVPTATHSGVVTVIFSLSSPNMLRYSVTMLPGIPNGAPVSGSFPRYHPPKRSSQLSGLAHVVKGRPPVQISRDSPCTLAMFTKKQWSSRAH